MSRKFMISKLLILRSLSFVTLLFAASCAIPGGPPLPKIAPEINATLAARDAMLAPGDVISVDFMEKSEWDQDEITIMENGHATFLALDDMLVAGMTTSELDAKLQEGYARYEDDPTLSVSVKTLGPRVVSVVGEVKAPGLIAISSDRAMTLVEAIGAAGGHLKWTADLGKILLVRWDAAKHQQISWVIDGRTKYWGAADTVFLQAYDLIYVPNKTADEIAIWIQVYLVRMIPFPRFLAPV